MPEFEIWEEGFCVQGNQAEATLLGKAVGETFDEACENFRYPADIKDGEGKVFIKKGEPLNLDRDAKGELTRGACRKLLPPGLERMNAKGNYQIWACQLFDNEADARKSHG